MSLETYHEKRDFKRTGEPKGGRVEAEQSRFVVHKHAARRLHYDLRLELDGVLKSWAIPKGPSLDPSVKRLAIKVEDHPIDYGDFEGVIPKGEYGGGEVIIWDRGRWTPLEDPHKGLERGKLKFSLDGEKLKGRFYLFRIGGQDHQWMLKKESDSAASTDNIIDERPRSVVSGKLIEELKEDHSTYSLHDLKSLPTANIHPSKFRPELATLVDDVPRGDEWLHEVKFDGYRMIAHCKSESITLVSRNGKDWTSKLGEVARNLASLSLRDAVLDGEVVFLDSKGRSNFQLLQSAVKGSSGSDMVYYLFDIVSKDGRDLRKLPLSERKHLLEQVLAAHRCTGVRYSNHVRGGGELIFAEACKAGLEGIVSKRADSKYYERRTRDWVKVKCQHRQEFIIAGYTQSAATGRPFASLILALARDGRLTYCGQVGTGFSGKQMRELYKRLTALQVPRPAPSLPANIKGARWVSPMLVCEVEFTEWTDDGKLRHPSFKGIREDKEPETVHFEAARAVESLHKASMKSAPRIEGITISNADREVFPGCGVSKLELARYYQSISRWILPHIRNRPLMLLRCPEGSSQCFYQKHASGGIPDTIPRVTVKESSGRKQHIYVATTEHIVALVQINVIEFHCWNSRVDRLEEPDMLVFDLDPDTDLDWNDTLQAAKKLRGLLARLHLKAHLKTTGGKGLHLIVNDISALKRALDASPDWNNVKGFCREVADQLVAEDPQRYTSSASKAKRKGKVFIDYLRNARGATSICAYSTRAKERLPVAVPLSWRELGVDSASFTIKDVIARMNKRKKNPW